MKRSLPLMIVCLIAVAGTTMGASTLNSLNKALNGNFETEAPGNPGQPADWYYNSTDYTSWTTAFAVSGTHSIEMNDTSSSAVGEWRSERIAINPGEKVAMSYYTEFSGITGNLGPFVRFFDANDNWLGQQYDGLSGTGSLQHREIHAVAPANTAYADIFIYTNDPANTGLARFDDIALDNNLVTNARMEMGTDDWFHGGGTALVTDPDATSYNHALEISDTDGGAYDWRHRVFPTMGLEEMLFSFESKRTGTDGNAFAFLRFWSGTDGNGGGTGWLGQETISLAGDTVGFESNSSIVNVPAGATFADVWFWTGAEDFTGNLRFDDIYAGAVPEPATLVSFTIMSLIALRRRRA